MVKQWSLLLIGIALIIFVVSCEQPTEEQPVKPEPTSVPAAPPEPATPPPAPEVTAPMPEEPMPAPETTEPAPAPEEAPVPEEVAPIPGTSEPVPAPETSAPAPASEPAPAPEEPAPVPEEPAPAPETAAPAPGAIPAEAAIVVGDLYAPITEDELNKYLDWIEKGKQYTDAHPETAEVGKKYDLMSVDTLESNLKKMVNEPVWQDFFTTNNIDKGEYVTVLGKFLLTAKVAPVKTTMEMMGQTEDEYIAQQEESIANMEGMEGMESTVEMMKANLEAYKVLKDKIPAENFDMYKKMQEAMMAKMQQ